MKIFRALAALLLVMLSACSAELNQYQNTRPKFDLFEYFSGELTAWGMVQDSFGQQTRRFEVKLQGSVSGDELVLVEYFVFDDSEKSQRIWRIVRTPEGKYLGKAEDIIGVAHGQEIGNALHWQYDFKLIYQGRALTVSLDDWLYRQDDKHAFNLTKIKKWGVPVGQITLFFQKH
jgi:hypothetical protein